MRRFRNPRYAPEALERKLHPSGVAPVLAEIYVPTATAAGTPTQDDSGDPGASDVSGGPAEPGDPIPSNSTPPDGSDPAPPPGNGDPPTDTPSIPVGPGEPN